jgi:protein disulfide-isomerase A1
LIPAWEESAEKLAAVNPNIVIAKCDATANEIPNVEIKGYPTIRYFPGNNKTKSEEFNGDRSTEGIIAWLKEHTTHPWVELGAEAATETKEEEPKKDDKKDDL